jgi:hypothetical protein
MEAAPAEIAAAFTWTARTEGNDASVIGRGNLR